MSRLKTKVGNIEFINPFILASAPPARNAEMIARAFELGWAGAVTKTICLNYKDMIDVSPRLAGIKGGLLNIELISSVSPEKWVEDIKFLKQNYPSNIVIASISAEASNIEGWQKLAVMTQTAGADMLELNFSCPHGLPEMGMGNTCSDNPEIAAKITKFVKAVSKIPVWTKLSPNVNSIKRLAELCLNSGADGITAINTVKGFAGVDVKTGLPKLNINGYSAYGGLSGDIIKPIALKAVSEIASTLKCNVSATGGIKNHEDAVEFILLGASTVQLCAEVMFKGYEIIKELKHGLNNYLEEYNFNSVNEIRGKSLQYIKPHFDLDKSNCLKHEINPEICINCGKCYKACRDAGYQAISYNGDNLLIDKQKCSGCGLCSIICPANAIVINNNENICSQFLLKR
ncbi:MAG TPA: NAD-dependent dihydropyrimidine dehydrogenase subunit PreA [Candidatus Gastranaerophilales bacterium]|nr:NAD-dependent dihydropyrimidine dehydrogenase subunit PreA [Candidatus Gastranaerophilales bacterium]